MKYIMAQKIASAMRQDAFIGAIVYGAQRIGKTSYTAQVLYEVYEDWNMVNDRILFKLEDVVAVLRAAVRTRTKIPVLVWDDAGIHANKLLYFQNRTLIQYLQNLIDVVGINLGCLLITTPNPTNLLKAIRGYEFYRIKVYRRDEYNGRYAVGYQSVLLPSGSRLIKRVFKDNYKVRLPDEFWQPYMEKRQGYLDEGLKRLEELALKNVPMLSGDDFDDNGKGQSSRAERTAGVPAVSG